MAYKVDYYTLPILKDKSIGNIKQTSGTAYTNEPIDKITETLNQSLQEDKLIAVVDKITKVKGKCI